MDWTVYGFIAAVIVIGAIGYFTMRPERR